MNAYLATVVKRWAESNVYDRLAQTPQIEHLKQLPPAAKYVLEAALSYIGAVTDANLPRNGTLSSVMASVITDAPAELSKRIINGKHGPKS